MGPAQSQTPDSRSDGDLVRQALRGERDAFGELVKRYEPLCFAIALRRLGDPDRAAEAAQDAFISAWEHLERLRRPESFASWVAVITHNNCRSRLRQRPREVVSLDELAGQGIEPADDGHPPAFEPELIAALRRALPRLPEKYREPIELRYTEDWSCKRVADFLGLSLPAVITRLHRGRSLLLRMLRREGWK